MNQLELRARLSKHIWYVSVNENGTHRLMCNGKPFPHDGPNHTIDFYLPPWDGTLPDRPKPVRVEYTSFDPECTTILCSVMAVDEPTKRQTALEWWEEQKPGTKLFIRAYVEGLDCPDWIKGYYQTSQYLHGWRDLSFLY